jgi:RHS repeat-associated protein
MGSGIMVEKVTGLSGTVQWNNYLFAGGEMVGMRVEHSAGAVYERYFHKDHLGSVSTITDETGAVTERFSYDAWGKRRNPDGSGATSGSIVSETTRGFTGHEQLDLVGMVHMNGRVYDPLLGRFTSADPMTENPFSTQGWNRYSYVGNSPVNFTDPSGYCFLGCFWKSVLSAIWRAIKPYLGTILRIAVAAMAYASCGPVCAAFASTVTSAFATGVSGGGLGHMLKAAMITALTAAAFSAVGNVSALAARPDYLGPVGGHVVKIVGHGAVGCLTTAASGGSCSSGGISAGVAAAVTPLVDIAFPDARTDARHLAGGTAALAGIGGLASVAGGGKFQNGAVTAAFGYLINQLSSGKGPNDRHELGRQEAMRDAVAQGYGIFQGLETLVSLPELGQRRYDFVIFDPVSAQQFGVEVKTSQWGDIFLSPRQVTSDAAVAGGQMGPAFGVFDPAVRVTSVIYYTYCYQCGSGIADLHSMVLAAQLMTARIQVYYGRRLP